MAVPFVASTLAAVRSAMRRHQHVPPSTPRVPMWRLLLGEVAYLAGRIVRLVGGGRGGT
jgi:hypothetical protein